MFSLSLLSSHVFLSFQIVISPCLSVFLCLSMFLCLYVRCSWLSSHLSMSIFPWIYVSILLHPISVSSVIFHPASSVTSGLWVLRTFIRYPAHKALSLLLSGMVPAAPRIGIEIILPSLQIWKLRLWLLVPGFHLWVSFSTF